jgi:hypothetical protein
MLRTFVDYRCGGKARYYLADREDHMLVPEEVRKCVGFVYCMRSGRRTPVGTVFFLGTEDHGTRFAYSVTARHVVDFVRERSDDQRVTFRVNRNNGGIEYVDTSVDDWRFHSDPAVDIAVLPGIPHDHDEGGLDIRSWSLEAAATDAEIARNQIGPGDEVFITGLFANHYGQDRNIPIVRIGNIAAMPEERVKTALGATEAYLIEARSIGGLSGSPAFAHLGMTRMIDGKRMHAPSNEGVCFLLGLVHGHYDVEINDVKTAALTDERINMGIAIVIPVQKIIDVVRNEEFAEMRKKDATKDEADKLPSMDSHDEDLLTKDGFTRILKRVSQRKAEPDQETKGT